MVNSFNCKYFCQSSGVNNGLFFGVLPGMKSVKSSLAGYLPVIIAARVGEQIDDLAPFDPAEFAQALTGSDN